MIALIPAKARTIRRLTATATFTFAWTAVAITYSKANCQNEILKTESGDTRCGKGDIERKMLRREIHVIITSSRSTVLPDG